MKKAVLSPLCSGLIVPGMGQIMNQQVMKGLSLMAAVFVLLVSATVNIFLIMDDIFQQGNLEIINPQAVMEVLDSKDFTATGIIVILSMAVWLYSIIDALINGIRLDKSIKENRQ